MAVYKRSYQPYTGSFTPTWSRFLVLPRFIYKDLFSSRVILAFFVLCFVVPLGGALLIYLRHNLKALEMLQLPLENFIAINNSFFLGILNIQGTFAFLLTAFVGPGLVSMDLANNALPLYLCRPFSRFDYVAGKMSVLLILLSLITWIPGLILFLLQSSLAGFGWFWDNLWMAGSIFLGAWIWILILSLLILAISAWVRWRPVAGAMLFGVFFVAAGFGEAVNLILDTHWGLLLDIGELIRTVWGWLFRSSTFDRISIASAWIALLALCGLSLFALTRRLKAYEVIR